MIERPVEEKNWEILQIYSDVLLFVNRALQSISRKYLWGWVEDKLRIDNTLQLPLFFQVRPVPDWLLVKLTDLNAVTLADESCYSLILTQYYISREVASIDAETDDQHKEPMIDTESSRWAINYSWLHLQRSRLHWCVDCATTFLPRGGRSR